MFLVPSTSISVVKFQEDWLIKSLPLGIKFKFPPTHVKTRNKVWLPWIITILMSNSTNTVVHFDGKEVGNLCFLVCEQGHTQYMQHRLAVLSFYLPNSSRHVLLRWNNRNNNIVFAHRIFIHFWICFWIIFSEYRCLKLWNSVNNFILWFYHLDLMCEQRMC